MMKCPFYWTENFTSTAKPLQTGQTVLLLSHNYEQVFGNKWKGRIIMVDWYGNWTYEPGTPGNQKCDCDRIADAIMESGYKVETTLENLVYMILLHFDCCDNYGEYDPETGCGGYGMMFTVAECLRYVEESGGYREFDYYC